MADVDARRMELQALLEDLLGSRNVYFQPPSNVVMQYPCIIYQREDDRAQYADNLVYRRKTRYRVTVVDSNPDSQIHKKVAKLRYSTFDRFFAADNLNHDVYHLFF